MPSDPEDTYALQDINVQNMNIELVAQMFKNYQSNVLFHLEGRGSQEPKRLPVTAACFSANTTTATDNLKEPS